MAPVIVLVSLFCATLASSTTGARVELTRIHSDPGVTASQFVRDALRRDMHRHNARQLAASDGTVSAPIRKSPPNTPAEYMMTLAIGTPPVSYQATADTGSDLIWTQCAPCGSQCVQQPTPLYNPSSSTTFSVLPCDSALSICAAESAGATPPPGCTCTYNQTYGLGWTSGTQGSETFTFGSTPADQARVPGIAFGCSNATSNDFNGTAGIVGLGRGDLSLVSQLSASKFSYCLTPFQDTNSTSTLLLGPSAALNATGVRSTPFVDNPTQPHYYLNLTGISLGTTPLSIAPDAFALKANGTAGGFIIDSGTTITTLVDAAYQQIRAAVLSLVTTLPTSTEGGLDLCFVLPSPTSAPPAMPDMTLHFDGGDMVLPADNYMISASGLWCLMMQTGINGLPSILGNYQQQNMHILYDLSQETLSFAPARCSAL
ncbi:hypothetical protein U9M48_030674 [Paspalum notatum var. saurae]|uniref:Peptidase A1 domain-containing protein n=1 Tax=Paspalum notatum var. saurae TaxID=547442 RepID=A0AAQ3U5R7_PASNO